MKALTSIIIFYLLLEILAHQPTINYNTTDPPPTQLTTSTSVDYLDSGMLCLHVINPALDTLVIKHKQSQYLYGTTLTVTSAQTISAPIPSLVSAPNAANTPLSITIINLINNNYNSVIK